MKKRTVFASGPAVLVPTWENPLMNRNTPNNMEKVEGISNEQVKVMQEIALLIFTDMCNAGKPLRETLAAIYLSGIQHAVATISKSDTGAGNGLIAKPNST